MAAFPSGSDSATSGGGRNTPRRLYVQGSKSSRTFRKERAVQSTSPIPRFPIRFRNSEILTIEYRSTRDGIARFVPEQLTPRSDRVMIHIYRLHDPEWFGSYGELAVHIPVRHERSGVEGSFSPMFVLASDAAIAAGREIFGQPKKAGTVTLARDGDLLVGRVQRNGIELLTATMAYKQRPSTPAALTELEFGTNINLKVIPAVDGPGDALRELTARDFTDVEFHGVWEGDATVELRPNAQVPVHLLPVLEVERAFHWFADFTAVYGRVLETLSTESQVVLAGARS
jgi:acetoacetate decarboxylase